mmetsp:Transcript_22861/g.68584  ORF Transcript_22861/g.68584 Transcript_22861/m.68584 type:complete len:305 (+) Transcript_22861:1455-2369(+)
MFPRHRNGMHVRAIPAARTPNARGRIAPGLDLSDDRTLHECFGHTNMSRAFDSAKDLGLPVKSTKGKIQCPHCAVANEPRTCTHPTSASAEREPPGHTIECDLATDRKPEAYGGTHHYFHTMDRGLGFVYTADIRTKDEALGEALAYVSAPQARGVHVRRLRFDAGREFTDAQLCAKLAELGIHTRSWSRRTGTSKTARECTILPRRSNARSSRRHKETSRGSTGISQTRTRPTYTTSRARPADRAPTRSSSRASAPTRARSSRSGLKSPSTIPRGRTRPTTAASSRPTSAPRRTTAPARSTPC